MKSIVKKNLFELGILKSKVHFTGSDDSPPAAEVESGTFLSFELHKELLLMQREIKRLELEEQRLSE